MTVDRPVEKNGLSTGRRVANQVGAIPGRNMDPCFALMIGAAALGFYGAPLWSVLIVAAVLTGLSSSKHAEHVRRYPEVGSGRVLAMRLGASALNNAAHVAMSFAAGRAFSWLVPI